MTAIKDGGPAFPAQWDDKDNEGMTLRDWFAGQAMRDTFAALAAAGYANFNEHQLKRCAQASYQAADAMLAAREAKHGR